tara:strand:- start:662 stop:829 length:168 start_codon:yes stop_codon:yes gene_type:complete
LEDSEEPSSASALQVNENDYVENTKGKSLLEKNLNILKKQEAAGIRMPTRNHPKS